MVSVKKSFNPTHTYVDLFIRFFFLNDGQGRAGLAERAHLNYYIIVRRPRRLPVHGSGSIKP